MISVIIAAALLLAGCSPSALSIDRAAPALSPEPSVYDDGAAGGIGRLGILEPEMFVYDVSAGGIFEYRDDWSKGASGKVMTAAALQLAIMGYGAAALPDVVNASELFALKTKMRYHSAAFQSAFFARLDIIDEIDTLVYSVGSQAELCDAFGVDGFLYIYGFEEKFSRERRKAVGESAAERTFMVAILVERDGRVSWYRHLLVSGNLDMRDDTHALRMMGAMFQ